MEELINCNTQTITQFLDRGYSSAVISVANNVIHGGLRYTAIIAPPPFDAVRIIRLQSRIFTLEK